MNTIQANTRGTRFIKVSEQNLETIKQYQLFKLLTSSHGLIDESDLNKIKLTIRSLIAGQEENSKNLLDLCIDVIYHKDMKAFGLTQLNKLYQNWLENSQAKDKEAAVEEDKDVNH